MIKDIGGDPTGENYAFLNSLFYIGYAPFSTSMNPSQMSIADSF